MKNSRMRDIFLNRNYLKLFTSTMIARCADSVDVVVYSWMVYTITNQAWLSAMIYAANQVPTVFLQPLAGAVVENMDKKKVYIISNIIRSIVVAGIMIIYMGGRLAVWMIVLSTFFISSAEAFNSPSATAMIPYILKKENYETAIAMSSSATAVMQMIGTVMAGIIIDSVGLVAALTMDCLLFFISSVLVLSVSYIKMENKLAMPGGSVGKSFMEGLQYVKGNRIAVLFCSSALLLNTVITPINSLQVPLVSEIYKSGSLMVSMIGIMIILGSCLGPMIGRRFPTCFLMRVSISGGIIGILICLYSLGEYIDIRNLAAYIYCSLISFFLGIVISMLSSELIIQLMTSTNEKFLARTASIMNSIGCAANPVAALLISALTGFISVGKIFCVFGGISIAGFVFLKFMERRTENA